MLGWKLSDLIGGICATYVSYILTGMCIPYMQAVCDWLVTIYTHARVLARRTTHNNVRFNYYYNCNVVLVLIHNTDMKEKIRQFQRYYEIPIFS